MKTFVCKLVAQGIIKSFIIISANLLIISSIFAQTPEKMSYQAVIRDAKDNLITNTQIGMQISILQGSSIGTAVYVETQEPTTNANGLVSIEIGTGTTSDDFSTIDWTDGPYFIKTETDPDGTTGGIVYTITGTSQLLSVPYALHAKSAETVTGGITETDPVYSASEAANITETDITNLNNLSGTNTGDQDISGIADNELAIQDTAAQIRADIPDVSGFLSSETDPALAANFDFTDAANGDLLQFNGTKWVKVTPDYISDYTVTESDVTAHQAALSVTESQISDLGSYIETETDPTVPTGTQAGEMQYWNGSVWVTIAPGYDGANFTLVDGMPTWVYEFQAGEVGNPTTGKIWMDKNLGASQVATSRTDVDAYGDIYQWGRTSDGHESRTSGTTSILSTDDSPGHSDFITNSSSPRDWRSPQNDNLWQGVSGTNNPCPSDYRLPTEAEWEAERTSWSSSNAAGAFASPLKLPVAGYRYYSNGSLYYVGSIGFYWSSLVGSTYSRGLVFGSDNAYMHSYHRAYGLSVRCIKD